MDTSLKSRIKNQIFKFEANIVSAQNADSTFTLDFEKGVYRQDDLVGLIRDTVPYFALTEDEINSIDKSELYKQSFTRISDANRQKKGDYGELLLFLILSIFYDVPKFVTKARLRSITREQIKGFDCAHFSIENDKVTLWLGEAKFYQDISGAISKALESLKEHLTDHEKIKSELKLLGGEIEINKTLEPDTFNLLKEYVSGGKSFDKVNICVPVLLTYDSFCIKKFCGNLNTDIESDDFKTDFEQEINDKFTNVYGKQWPTFKNIKIVFFIMPFESVSDIKQKIEQVENCMKF